MAFRYGQREQRTLLPPSIEEYVTESHPVRAYDAFVDTLEMAALGIDLDADKVGNAAYDPRAMLKLLVYGYSYGIRSSRKLERATHENLSFIWLLGGLKPDHKTIAEFRRKHVKGIKKVLRQSVWIAIELDLIAGNVLFVDGTKIRANAGRGRTHNRAYYQTCLKEIEGRIDRLLAECEEIDWQEEGLPSLISMRKDLAKAEALRQRIEQALAVVPETCASINLTDPDCRLMHSVQGSHASYNVQIVGDGKQGLLVQAEPVQEATDVHQFANQIDQANEVLARPCQVACADAGYADTKELAKIAVQGIEVVVPSQRQALHEGEKPFSKSHFSYDPAQDVYRCPEGHTLTYAGMDKRKGNRHYQIGDAGLCRRCPHYGTCTQAERGRKIIRLAQEELKQKFETKYQASKDTYALRKTVVELPFGHKKRNLKVDAFLLRGLEGVGAETSLLATCFNLVRMITLKGVVGLVKKLRALGVRPLFPAAQSLGFGPTTPARGPLSWLRMLCGFQRALLLNPSS